MSTYILGQIIGTRPKRKHKTEEQKRRYKESRREWLERWNMKMRGWSATMDVEPEELKE